MRASSPADKTAWLFNDFITKRSGDCMLKKILFCAWTLAGLSPVGAAVQLGYRQGTLIIFH